MAVHGAANRYVRAFPLSMLPHDGKGEGTPRPRKLKEASARIADPSSVAPMMMIGAMTFGRMCLNMIRKLLLPMALDASTYTLFLSASTAPRTTRLLRGIKATPIAMATLTVDGPNAVRMA